MSEAAAPAIGCVVADDHPANLDSVCRFLQGEAGFEVLGRVADGESALTVRTHFQHVMEKLSCQTRTQAVAVALRESLIQ